MKLDAIYVSLQRTDLKAVNRALERLFSTADVVSQKAWHKARRMTLIRTREYFERRPLQLARSLLGDVLVHTFPTGAVRRGRIVETEAYLGPHDLAAHSSKGRTERTEVMFGQSGLVYVYFIYGMHHCINVVTGNGSAVLIRALEPLDGLDARLDGPGRLTKVFGIDRSHNGLDFAAAGSPLFIEAGIAVPSRDVLRGPRVGLGACEEWADKPYRFRIKA